MGLSRRTFTREFKLAAVRRLEEGASLTELSRGFAGERHGVKPLLTLRWSCRCEGVL